MICRAGRVRPGVCTARVASCASMKWFYCSGRPVGAVLEVDGDRSDLAVGRPIHGGSGRHLSGPAWTSAAGIREVKARANNAPDCGNSLTRLAQISDAKGRASIRIIMDSHNMWTGTAEMSAEAAGRHPPPFQTSMLTCAVPDSGRRLGIDCPAYPFLRFRGRTYDFGGASVPDIAKTASGRRAP